MRTFPKGSGSARKSSLHPSDYVAKGGWYPIGIYLDGRFAAQNTNASGLVNISATKSLHIREGSSEIKMVFFAAGFVEGFTSTGKVRAGMASTFKADVARQNVTLSMVGGTATSGTFRIGYMVDASVNRTVAINFNATVAQVQSALDTLMAAVSAQTGEAATCTVTGANFPAGTMTFEMTASHPCHNILGLFIESTGVSGATPTFALGVGARTSMQFPPVDGGPVTDYPNWGYNESLITTLPATISVNAGDRLQVRMVWLNFERTTIAGVSNTATRFPSQNGFANRYQANKQFNGRYTIDAITTGNDIIAGSGTPSAISFTGGGTIVPAMILGRLSGLTRRLNVVVMGNSILGTVQNCISQLEALGFNVISWGHSGSHPREAMDDPDLHYMCRFADAVVWAMADNLINPQAFGTTEYFGGASVTNTTRFVNELFDMAEAIGKPFFVVPPYLMGLNAADMTAQTITKATDQTAYDRCLDFRTRVAERIAADPRNGVLLDVYGQIIVDGSDQGLNKRYLYHDLPGGKTGIAFWRLDVEHLNGSEPSDTNVFAWRCGTFTGSAGNGNFRGWRRDGGDNAQGLAFAYRHTARQEQCFGPSDPDHNSGISFVSKPTFNGTRLVCYKGGGGSPAAVGQTAHIRTLTAGSGMFLNGNNQTFRLDEAPTAGTTYPGSWWAMDFVVDSVNSPYSSYPLTDSNGHVTNTTGLHLNVGVVSALWYLALTKTFVPLMNAVQREA